MKNFWKNKKVLVAGGAGFIGSHVVEEILSRGAIVTITVSPKTSLKKVKQNLSDVYSRIRVIKVDLLSAKDTIRAGEDQDVILNFAGLDGGKTFKIQYPALLFATNVQMGLNILESARANNVKSVLIVSSIEVYTKSAKNPITEDQGFLIDAVNEIEGYAWAKRVIEIAAKNYHKQYAIPIAVARLGNIYGPRDYVQGDRVRVVSNFIKKAINGDDIAIAGDGLYEIPLLYVKDAVVGMLDLVEKYATADPVNLVSSTYISLKELAVVIKKVVGSSSKLHYQNGTGMITNKKRVFSNVKAKEIIEFNEKYTFEKGIKETFAYFQASK